MSVICEATSRSYVIEDSTPSLPASALPRQDSGLCARCEVLALDDGKQGGQVRTENGEDFVSFGDKRWLDLDYKLEDRLPDLPALSASATAGCGFCRLLKIAILRLVGGEKTPVPPDRSHVLAKHLKFLLKPGHNHDHFRSNHDRDQTVFDELAIELFFSRDEHIDECRKPRPSAGHASVGTSEWLLSPRKLVFRDDMVYFQAGTRREAENGYITHDESLDEWSNSLKNTETAMQRWYELMEEYSLRDLTYQQDRLPAICGLARDVSDRLGLEYVAGLWASDLQKGLLWTTLAEDDEDKIPLTQRLAELTSTDAYLAPSWSWVSYPHGILWSLPGLDLSSSHISLLPSCELVSAVTTADGLNPFGRIKAGHLKIRGKFCQLPSPKVYLASKSQSRLLTIRTTKPDRDIATVELDFRFDHHITYEGFITPLTLRDTPLEGLSLLMTSKLDDKTVGGLILLPTGVESEFRRVGIVVSNPRGMRAFDEFETHKIRIV
ncbi:Heterokaryon incompatibility protein [Lasiodiplodia theobromae]|uniref:Heterokaryon incompatibility protein n=1 Tax=Lasiodiplodia theobromae TaxID=45133 RepID=UPI0015C3CC66|nr:Heterokaryon incompatibility protein [Lasiodiplodia theobromae]KAF4544567.1 Heterokaryon incompatibility protein [Lasiodiplodia theobromae]